MWLNHSCLVAVAVTGLWLVGQAAADTIHVPGDQPTIQAAINVAMNGDEIIVAEGMYIETINFFGKAINLYSSGGPDVTIIDAVGAAPVVTCNSGEGPDSILDGFTITGGNQGEGGGMQNNNSSSPTVINCMFIGNTGFDGGGMHNNSCSPTVINCSFSGNSAISSNGGGMYNSNGSSPTVANCTFIGNSASLNGGGMANIDSNPTVINCTFSGNTSDLSGSGMANFDSNPIVTNCTFSGNIVNALGGGMFNVGSSPMVTNCMFSGNFAGADGGGMFNLGRDSNPTVINCTFSGNNTAGNGGGMLNANSSNPTLTNCILWGDSPDEIFNQQSASPTLSYSDVRGGLPDGTIDGGGNIDADPLFVDPDGADDIPGTEDDDLRLLGGSPCIDAANNSAIGIKEDLDGNPRFVDDPNTKDTGNGKPPIVDMGAYEFQVVSCTWDLDGDGNVGAGDLILLLGSWGDPYGTADLIVLLGNWGPCR